MLPFLLWLAARLPPPFGIAGAFAVSVAVMLATTFGMGRFGDASVAITERFKGAQAAMTVVTLYTLMLTTLFAERRRNEAVLKESERRFAHRAELDHRVKNVLAQVAVVAVSTRQDSHSIDEFLRSLNGRIQSMAAAHTLLSKSGWQRVGLDALVRNQLAPYATNTNVTISGTDIMLTAAEIQAVAKVLHELVTNAAKHGALSIPGGHISVNWDRKPNGDRQICC